LDAETLCPHVRRHLLLDEGESAVRFVPYSVALSWRVRDAAADGRTTEVTLASYVSASHDPLAGWESLWLAHLDRDHSHQVRELVAAHVDLTSIDLVRPILVDASGLVFRVYSTGGTSDVRIPFPEPVTCPAEAVAGFEELLSTERPVRRA